MGRPPRHLWWEPWLDSGPVGRVTTRSRVAMAHALNVVRVNSSYVDGGNMAKGQAAQPIAPEDDTHRLAQTVRESSICAALDGYERAGLGGLCAEGRWEMAIDAIRSLDLDAVVHGSQRL